MVTCLILGRKGFDLENIRPHIEVPDVTLLTGAGLQDVEEAFDKHKVDVVIMGAGLDISDRIDMVRYIFERSSTTTIHMKDWQSGTAGMPTFVRKVLSGIYGHP